MEEDQNVDRNRKIELNIPFHPNMKTVDPVVPAAHGATGADFVLCQPVHLDQNFNFQVSDQSIIPEDPEILSPSPPAQYDCDRMTKYLADCAEHEETTLFGENCDFTRIGSSRFGIELF